MAKKYIIRSYISQLQLHQNFQLTPIIKLMMHATVRVCVCVCFSGMDVGVGGDLIGKQMSSRTIIIEVERLLSLKTQFKLSQSSVSTTGSDRVQTVFR